MNWNRHYIKHETRFGRAAMHCSGAIGRFLLRAARRCFKWGCGHCTWCGSRPGFDSTVSRKGLRCQTLDRDCTKMP